MFFKPKNPVNAGNNVITDFEIITLRTSGMRNTTEQEIVRKDAVAEVSEYYFRCVKDGGRERVLERRTEVSIEEILSLLNDCKILSWDGFVGKHPKGVLDGTQFTLSATVNEDVKIYAHGSQNFPKTYRQFTDGLYEIMKDVERISETGNNQ